MAGEGKKAFHGIGIQSVIGTAVAPTVYPSFTGGSIKTGQGLIASQSLSGSRVVENVTETPQQPSFELRVENDAQAPMYGYYLWNVGNPGHATTNPIGGGITAAPTNVAAAGAVVNPHVAAVSLDNEATYTSYLTEVTGAGHMQLDALNTAANGDRFYVGSRQKFDTVTVTMFGAEVNAVVSVLSAEYWSASGWKTVAITDGTIVGGATLAQSGTITFTIPSDWAQVSQKLYSALGTGYLLRFSVSVQLSATVSIDTLTVTGDGLAAGDYNYKVASVLNFTAFDREEVNFIMPASTVSLDVTVAANGKNTVTFTDPSGLTPPTGFTVKGVVIFRTAVGPAGDHAYVGYVNGTGSTTFVDYHESRDTTVVDYTTTIKEQTFTLTADDEAQLDYFTLELNPDLAESKRLIGARCGEFSHEVADQGSISKWTFAGLGQQVDKVNKSTATVQVKKPITGGRIVLQRDGVNNCDVESFNVQGTNELEFVGGLCGTNYPIDVKENGLRAVTGQLTRKAEDYAYWDKVQTGTKFSLTESAYGEPAGENSVMSNASHGINANAFCNSMILHLPSCRASNSDADVPDGGGRIVETVDFQAFKDSVSGNDISLRFFNTVASVF